MKNNDKVILHIHTFGLLTLYLPQVHFLAFQMVIEQLLPPPYSRSSQRLRFENRPFSHVNLLNDLRQIIAKADSIHLDDPRNLAKKSRFGYDIMHKSLLTKQRCLD